MSKVNPMSSQEWRKKRRHSDETKRKMSEAHKGRVFSEATRKKISESLTGKKASPELRKKLSEARLRWLEVPENREANKLAHKYSGVSGETNGVWKGEDAKYSAKHMWLRYMMGPAQDYFCVWCNNSRIGTVSKKPVTRMHWANLDHKYTRDLDMWLPLCAACHKEYDLNYLGCTS